MIWFALACVDDPTESKPADSEPVDSDPVDSDPADSPPIDSDSGDTGPPDDELPGVWRIGPPAPSVGIYGLAAHPDGTEVYVSNLHVPWITVVDPATGGWIGAIALGVDSPSFPVLAVVDRTLYATAFDRDTILRFDVDSHAALPPLVPDDAPAAIEPAADGLWVALSTGVAVRYVGDAVERVVTLPTAASALAVENAKVAWLAADSSTVGLGDEWQLTLDDVLLNDIALLGDTVYVTSRVEGDVIALRDGVEIKRVHTGSDTFAIYADGGQLLVTNRQGAALPESGAYEGAPGRVTALDADLNLRWTVDLDRTVHFLAFTGDDAWVANEDALRMSSFNRQTGDVVVEGPRVGLTLDSFVEHDGTLWFPSHLSDELWSLEGDQIETCGWPFVGVEGDKLWIPCQVEGDLFAPEGDVVDVASTFQTGCGDDGLCTSHDLLLDATWFDGQLWYTDPYDVSVRAMDGTRVELHPSAEEASHAQHLALAALADTLYVFEPRDQTVYEVGGEAVMTVDGGTADFALVVDQDRLWAGGQSLDGQTLPGIVTAAGDGWVLAQEMWNLVVYDRSTLTEVGRRDLATLRVPLDPSPLGDPRPMRLRVDGDVVWVANLLRGTVERLSLPDLEPLGTDEVRPVGRWAAFEGVY